MWECQLPNDENVENWLWQSNDSFIPPLNPQDAFFGGRCNVTKLIHDFETNEKGRYVDFVSFYPSVNFSKPYPIGHPTKILNPNSFDPNWFGFIKCQVLPPKKLFHPVFTS